MFGPFYFNQTPLAPPGTKTIIHKRSNTRGLWDYHGTEALYIGPSMDHYRFLKCYNPKTMKEIDTDTLELEPNTTPIPLFTDTEAIEQSISDILYILKNPSKNNIPKVLIGDKIRNAFCAITDILGRNSSSKLPSSISNQSSTANEHKTSPISTTNASDIVNKIFKIPQQVIPVQEKTQAVPRVQKDSNTTKSVPPQRVRMKAKQPRNHQPYSNNSPVPNPRPVTLDSSRENYDYQFENFYNNKFEFHQKLCPEHPFRELILED